MMYFIKKTIFVLIGLVYSLIIFIKLTFYVNEKIVKKYINDKHFLNPVEKDYNCKKINGLLIKIIVNTFNYLMVVYEECDYFYIFDVSLNLFLNFKAIYKHHEYS